MSSLPSFCAWRRKPSERVLLCVDAMDATHAALISIDYAHKALPHVEFPHITRRRIAATRHACEYLLTDAADAVRFRYTAALLEAFAGSVDRTHRWLCETFERTLRVNLADAELVVREQTRLLHAERARYMAASEVAQRLYVGREKQRVV